jgi:hypothetical protein
VKAKAVEYVRICSLYGAGFYYIPAPTPASSSAAICAPKPRSIRAGTYNGQFSSINGAHNGLTNYYTTRSRADLNIDTRTATEYGVVRTYFDAVYTWTSGATPVTAPAHHLFRRGPAAASCVGNPSDGGLSGGALGVYFASSSLPASRWARPSRSSTRPDQLSQQLISTVCRRRWHIDRRQPVHLHLRLRAGRVCGALGAGSDGLWHHQHLERLGRDGQRHHRRRLRLEQLWWFALADLIGMVRVDQAWGLLQFSAAGARQFAGLLWRH